MIIGNAANWLNQFRGFDERLLPRIVHHVKAVSSLLGDNPLEDDITLNLVSRLCLDPEAREVFEYFEYQFEPDRIDENGVAKSLGKIDMAAHVSFDRKTYLAYECKRLNVSAQKSTSSLATPYVKEGVYRFVTEQYSEDLPVGCMLGYVVNGQIVDADTKVRAALVKLASDVAMNGALAPVEAIPGAQRFSSKHTRKISGTDIELRHALVSCK